jgi:hypothetical protein
MAPADDDAEYPPITTYAAVGDCRTVALVSRQGSVDWLCLPNISGPSVFAAMLDRRRGGRFALRPSAPFRTERRYLEGTNVLETTFITGSGRARVFDLMPINGADGNGLEPERELLRIAEGVEGEVEFEALYEARPDYGRALPRLVRRGALGWVFQHRGERSCSAPSWRCARPPAAPGCAGRPCCGRGTGGACPSRTRRGTCWSSRRWAPRRTGAWRRRRGGGATGARGAASSTGTGPPCCGARWR